VGIFLWPVERHGDSGQCGRGRLVEERVIVGA
jgi:hypothetical protein